MSSWLGWACHHTGLCEGGGGRILKTFGYEVQQEELHLSLGFGDDFDYLASIGNDGGSVLDDDAFCGEQLGEW